MNARPHVLVADDDDGIRRLIAHELSRAGFAVIEVAGYDDAIAVLGAEDVCAVVSDYDMGPGPSGVTLLSYVRDHDPSRARVLVSGSSAREFAGFVRAGIAHTFVQKPWPRGVIAQVVTRLVGHSGLPADPVASEQLVQVDAIHVGGAGRS